MSHWTIQRQLATAFGAVLLLMAILGAMSFMTVRRLNTRSATDAVALASTVHVSSLTMQLSAAADMVVVGGYKRDKKQIDEEWSGVDAQMAELRSSVSRLKASTSVPENRTRADQLIAAMDAWHGLAEKAAGAARDGNTAAADAAMQESERFSDDSASQLVDRILTAELDEGNRTRAEAESATSITGGILGVLALLVTAGTVMVLRRTGRQLTKIAEDFRDGIHTVHDASSQVAGLSGSLSQGTIEQAASLEQTSASMEEMASMTRQNAENSKRAAQVIGDVDRQVANSNHALAAMVTSMAAIESSSEAVSKIIRTIDEIAFQTNILALNAAVEAARAGAAGTGFAVVADEVRGLAQRSAKAAQDTAVLIEESIARARTGAEQVSGVTTAMAAITEGVGKVKGLVDDVSVASSQQAQGVEQVSQAIAQMEKVTQGTAATAEESAAASQVLKGQAEVATAVVTRLEGMVGADTVEPKALAPVVALRPKASATRGEYEKLNSPVLKSTGTYGRF